MHRNWRLRLAHPRYEFFTRGPRGGCGFGRSRTCLVRPGPALGLIDPDELAGEPEKRGAFGCVEWRENTLADFPSHLVDGFDQFPARPGQRYFFARRSAASAERTEQPSFSSRSTTLPIVARSMLINCSAASRRSTGIRRPPPERILLGRHVECLGFVHEHGPCELMGAPDQMAGLVVDVLVEHSVGLSAIDATGAAAH